MRHLLRAWRLTAKILTSQRKLWAPFILTALIELLFVGILWLAPQPPFSKVLAPPIRYFFGDKFLHYPLHLWFLYHAMKHTNLVASILVGAFMSGVACAMVRQVHEQAPLSMRGALVGREVAYGRVAFLWLVIWGITKGVMELAFRFFLVPGTRWASASVIGLTIILQALFVYAIPTAVFNDSKWWKALWQSLREMCRYPFSTFSIVLPPSALVILFAVVVSPVHVAQWMVSIAPEVAIPLVVARLVVWTIGDALLTISVAHLWCAHHASELVIEPAEVAAVPAARRKPVLELEEGPAVA